MAAEELVLLARDDKTVSLAVILATTTPSSPASETEAEAATFRLVVEQSYRCGGGEDEVDTMEDVACRVPVAELRDAAAVDRAFEELLAKLDHPTLRPEVAPAARDSAARVRARCAEEGARLGGAEFCLRVVFIDSFDDDDDDDDDEEEPAAEPDCGEETGSDLEFDESSWARGRSESAGGAWRHEHGPAALSDGDGGGGGGAQFSARPFDGALAREGGPSDGTLLLSGFEARADGPELGDQHELTPRDVRRLAVSGGDVGGDEGYQRAVDGGAPVSRVTRAVMLDQGLRSARQQQARPQQEQQAGSTRGMPPRMRTGL